MVLCLVSPATEPFLISRVEKSSEFVADGSLLKITFCYKSIS